MHPLPPPPPPAARQDIGDAFASAVWREITRPWQGDMPALRELLGLDFLTRQKMTVLLGSLIYGPLRAAGWALATWYDSASRRTVYHVTPPGWSWDHAAGRWIPPDAP